MNARGILFVSVAVTVASLLVAAWAVMGRPEPLPALWCVADSGNTSSG